MLDGPTVSASSAIVHTEPAGMPVKVTGAPAAVTLQVLGDGVPTVHEIVPVKARFVGTTESGSVSTLSTEMLPTLRKTELVAVIVTVPPVVVTLAGE